MKCLRSLARIAAYAATEVGAKRPAKQRNPPFSIHLCTKNPSNHPPRLHIQILCRIQLFATNRCKHRRTPSDAPISYQRPASRACAGSIRRSSQTNVVRPLSLLQFTSNRQLMSVSNKVDGKDNLIPVRWASPEQVRMCASAVEMNNVFIQTVDKQPIWLEM